jgi:hypothetical protein
MASEVCMKLLSIDELTQALANLAERRRSLEERCRGSLALYDRLFVGMDEELAMLQDQCSHQGGSRCVICGKSLTPSFEVPVGYWFKDDLDGGRLIKQTA